MFTTIGLLKHNSITTEILNILHEKNGEIVLAFDKILSRDLIIQSEKNIKVSKRFETTIKSTIDDMKQLLGAGNTKGLLKNVEWWKQLIETEIQCWINLSQF